MFLILSLAQLVSNSHSNVPVRDPMFLLLAQFESIDNSNPSLPGRNIVVAQGSTLAPFLFVLYIDLSNSFDFTPRFFADGTCLMPMVTSPSMNQFGKFANRYLRNQQSWYVDASKQTN